MDLPSASTFLASERPDLVEKWQTTDDDYYAKHTDKDKDALRAGPLNQEMVCDRFGSFAFLPVRESEVSEVLARHVWEHQSISEARSALANLYRAMTPGGVLRLDVPDHTETLKLFRQTGDEFFIRHLVGPRRGDFGFHMMSYTRERLTALVESSGFLFSGEEDNPHFYPAFTLDFRRL